MIPDHAYATEQTMHRCGPCPFNWDDCHAPEGKTVWCRLLRHCATCPGPRTPFNQDTQAHPTSAVGGQSRADDWPGSDTGSAPERAYEDTRPESVGQPPAHFIRLRAASEEETLYPRWYEGYRTVEK